MKNFKVSQLNIRPKLLQSVYFAKKNWLHIVTLLALFITLGFLIKSYNSSEYIDVLVASNNLSQGQKIRSSDVTATKLPKESNINGVILTSNKDSVVNTYISTNLKKGDLVLAHHLYENKEETETLDVSSEKKIFFMSDNDVQLIPYNVNPNDKISIYGLDPQTNKSQIILNQVRVLSVDKMSKDKGKFPSFISIELGDEEIFAINFALSNDWFLQMVLHP